MTPRLPYFLRRTWRLLEAKRALFEGAPERALDHLRDPSLTLSPRADHLRERAMDVLFRSAAHKAQEGRDASVARILRVAASEDPRRASDWALRFRPAPDPAAAGGRLGDLVAQMRASAPAAGPQERPPRREQQGEQPRAPGAPANKPDRAPDRPSDRATESAADAGRGALRFHLAVDDGGEFLVVSGRSITLGHARAGLADVTFLADLESIHARLTWSESFHGGPRWTIEGVGRARIRLAGRAVEGARPLADEDEVQLSNNLALRFRVPEPSSASAMLQLLHGAEAEGAQKVILMTPGAAGRVRIGPKRDRHVSVAGLEHEVALTLESGGLLVACEGGVRVFGPDGLPAAAARERRIPLPLARRIDVLANARPSQTPPFGLALSPTDPRGGVS